MEKGGVESLATRGPPKTPAVSFVHHTVHWGRKPYFENMQRCGFYLDEVGILKNGPFEAATDGDESSFIIDDNARGGASCLWISTFVHNSIFLGSIDESAL